MHKQFPAWFFRFIGCIYAALALAMGAFAAHGLRNHLSPDALAVFHTAAYYQGYHGLGLLLIGFLLPDGPGNSLIKTAGWLMLAGTFIFSGSLYLLSLTHMAKLGIFTPIGGSMQLLAWIMLAIAMLNSRRETHL